MQPEGDSIDRLPKGAADQTGMIVAPPFGQAFLNAPQRR
nr:MAG TPA: hypothetical protein [Caudoviricetes sp.]